MLRVHVSQSAVAARTYFNAELSRGDYYSQGQEIAGHWGGRGAARLGLEGEVERDAFHALCDNTHPETGELLTLRQKDRRRVGYDFNFHAPKKLSVLYGLTGNERILDAFREAVGETMRELERAVACRVRDGGRNTERITGEMVWAEFVHFTARPVDNTPDPHLHAHCFAFNATWDKEHRGGAWKAFDVAGIKRDGRYYEAAFHARLSRRLAEFGFSIERDGKGYWDLGNVSDSVREKFSRRTAEVEARARKLGLEYPEDKARLGAMTRAAKRKGVSLDELRLKWNERLTAKEREQLLGSGEGGNGGGISPVGAVDWALEHGFTRESAVGEKQLAEFALRRGLGSVKPDEIWEELARRKEIVRGNVAGRALCTTREVLAEEKAMVGFARAGRSACVALGLPNRQPKSALFRDPSKDTREQEAAVRHVLSSCDRVIAVRGAAGTGKTALMREAVLGIEEHGRKVYVFAPGAQAARGVLRKEGFDEAQTVAQLLKSRRLQEKLRGQVMWIDEAGTLGARDMSALFRVAEQQDCRVVLSGDTHQHGSVLRGDALRVLEARGGVQSVEIKGIRRQRSNREYLKAVKTISEGRVEEGFERLEKMGALVEISGDVEARHRRLAGDYLQASGERNRSGKPKSVLVVSPTHGEGEAVTSFIRRGLREKGGLGTKEIECERLVNLARTEAEKKDVAGYEPGMRVQFFQNLGKFRRGRRYEVTRVEEGRVLVKGEGGAQHLLALDHVDKFQLYEARGLALSPGDRIRITQNSFSKNNHRLNNGSIYGIKEIKSDGEILLDNGWTLGSDFAHLAHGYCTTSHAAQGKTVDEVLIAEGTESLAAASMEQFYVSVSRGREAVRIYTDDREGLLRRVQDSGKRVGALEVASTKESLPARPKRHAQLVSRLGYQARAMVHRALEIAVERGIRGLGYEQT